MVPYTYMPLHVTPVFIKFLVNSKNNTLKFGIIRDPGIYFSTRPDEFYYQEKKANVQVLAKQIMPDCSSSQVLSECDPEFSAQEFLARNVQHRMFSVSMYSTIIVRRENVKHIEEA